MINKRVLVLVLFVGLSWLGFQGCSKKNPGEELKGILAQAHLPFTIKAMATNFVPQDKGNLVTLSDCEFRLNPAFIKAINPSMDKLAESTLVKLTFPVKEAVFYFQPGEKLEFVSMKGMQFKLDQNFLEVFDAKKDADISLTFNIDDMQMQGADFTPALNKNLTDAQEFLLAIIASHAKYAADLSGITANINFQNKQDNSSHFKMIFAAQTMAFKQEMAADFVSAIYKKGQDKSWISKLLAENKSLFNVSMKLTQLALSGSYSVQAAENIPASEKSFTYKTDDISFAYMLMPTPDKTAFTFSTQTKLAGLKLDLPHSPALNKAFDLRKLDMSFSLSPLSDKLIGLYLEMSAAAMEANQKGEAGKEELTKQMTNQGMAMFGEFMSTKPVLTMTIEPLEHPWTTITAKASFAMPSMMGPVGKAEMTVGNAANLLETIARELNLSKEDLKKIADMIKEYLVIDANGTGTMVLEMKEGAANKPIINGK